MVMVTTEADQSLKAFQVGHSRQQGWQEAVDECSDQVIDNLKAKNLGFVYATDAFHEDMDSIIQRLQSRTGVENWVGSTGIGILRGGHEDYDSSAMNIMIGGFPENSFKVFTGALGELRDFKKNYSGWFENNIPTFSVIHADPQTASLSRLIPNLSDVLNDAYLVGALSSSRGRNVQVANGVINSGISGVMFSENVRVFTGITQGCSPIGPQRTVTNARQNIIFSIDDRPALEVFKEDIGEELSRDIGRIAGNIFAALPVVGSDTADYLVRNVVGVDPQHKLLAIGDNVESGSSILFCQRDKSSAEKDLSRMVQLIRRRCQDLIPRGALYFSCLGRGRHTFGEGSNEMRLIQRDLGDVPLVGFFANGEISHHRLYSYTGVLTLFL